MHNAVGAEIHGNRVTGQVEDTERFATAGVMLAGCWSCTVAGNVFRTEGAENYWWSVANFGFYSRDGAASRGVIVSANDAAADAAPQGAHYISFDSFGTDIFDNKGAGWIDHSHCGDGQRGWR